MREAWFRDRDAWAFMGLRFLPWMAVLGLAWETLQLPLYAIWTEGSAASMAFAVIHCTLGDLVIASACLFLALILEREGSIARWRWWRIGLAVLILGSGYTLFSEWLNTALWQWGYSDLMPTLNLAGVEIGASPLLQWLVLPPLALYLARRGSTPGRDGPSRCQARKEDAP